MYFMSERKNVAVNFAAEAPALSSSKIESWRGAKPLAQDILIDCMLGWTWLKKVFDGKT